MRNHAGEEGGVKPRKRAAKTGDQAPRQSKEQVAGVVDLARLAVPSVGQDAVAILRPDHPWVLNRLPWKLWECLADDLLASLLGTETVLLAVGRIPNPVNEEVYDKQGTKGVSVPAVGIGVVVGKVEDAVAVSHGHARQVPKDEHEAPLLKVHVPGADDQFLALGTRIRVQVVGHDEETDLARDIAVVFVLPGGRSRGQEKQKVPWDPDLEEHLEIENAKHSGVELSTHEEVVEGVARHPVLGAADKC